MNAVGSGREREARGAPHCQPFALELVQALRRGRSRRRHDDLGVSGAKRGRGTDGVYCGGNTEQCRRQGQNASVRELHRAEEFEMCIGVTWKIREAVRATTKLYRNRAPMVNSKGELTPVIRRP